MITRRKTLFAILAAPFMAPFVAKAVAQPLVQPKAQTGLVEYFTKAEIVARSVRPPMGADPALKNIPMSIIPGHITYVTYAGGATRRKGTVVLGYCPPLDGGAPGA